MEAPQMLASRAAGAGGGRRRAGGAQQHAAAAAAAAAAEPRPWNVIWSVGGLCWLVMTGTALLWMLPESGPATRDAYADSTQTRLLQHLLAFLAAAPAYRVA